MNLHEIAPAEVGQRGPPRRGGAESQQAMHGTSDAEHAVCTLVFSSGTTLSVGQMDVAGGNFGSVASFHLR